MGDWAVARWRCKFHFESTPKGVRRTNAWLFTVLDRLAVA
jgi:hypothetical protein